MTDAQGWLPIETIDLDGAHEEWRPIVGYPDYQVSNLGRVRTAAGRMLGQWKNDQGYCLVRLRSPRRVARVHRLVAEAFVPNHDNKPFVNHLNCVRFNNEASNLEWCSQIDNLRHSERLGRMQKDYWLGKRSPNAVLSDAQVREMRSMYATGGYSWAAIGRTFGVSKRCAGRAITRETYADVQ